MNPVDNLYNRTRIEDGKIVLKAFKVTKLFMILWGLVGLWILLGGTLLAFSSDNNQWIGFLFLVGMFVLVYLMVTDRPTKKREYSIWDLVQRGILLLMIILVPVLIATYSVGTRLYLIPFVAVLVILLVLLGFELRKAEKIFPDQ